MQNAHFLQDWKNYSNRKTEVKGQAYLEEIRRAEGLKRAVLQKITVSGREVTFHLITDVSYTAEDLA